MPITFACPCGKLFRVPVEWAGKRARCKGCGDTIVVPEPDEDEVEPAAAEEEPAVYDLPRQKPAPEPKAKPAPEPPARLTQTPARTRRSGTGAKARQQPPPRPAEPEVYAVEQTEPPPQAPAPATYAMEGEDKLPTRPGRVRPTVEKPEPEATRTEKYEPDRYKDLDSDSPRGFREWAYLFLLVALVPLVIALLTASEDSTKSRLSRSLPPELQDELDAPDEGTMARIEEYVDTTTAGRIEGALLPRKTIMHWVFAFLAAVFFLWLALVVFPTERERVVPVLLAGAFTGTVGIALLVAVQFIAAATQGMFLISRNPIIMIVFWVCWAIGFSYRAALDPSFSFVGSFLGYTFGVGLCEEVCKAMPLIWYYRASGRASWREARAWGFASGVGFGVAEAVMYSADHYNGFALPGTYAVRFISCITLHAIWSTSVVLFIHKHQTLVQGHFHWAEWIPRIVVLVAVPMVLHGLYDTALKKDMPLLALAVALVSFAWLAWRIEDARKSEDSKPARAW